MIAKAIPTPIRLVGQEIVVVGAALTCVLLAHPSGFAWAQPTAIAACLALPLRLRWPWLAMLVCLVGLSGELGLSPALVALYRIGRTAPAGPAIAWTIAAVLTPEIPILSTEKLAPRDAALSILFTILWMTAPTALGMLVTTRQRLAASVVALRLAQESALEARVEQARAQERARIGREIHDAVGHHATLIAVESAALAATTNDAETQAAATRMRDLAKASLAEMRAALGLANTDGGTALADLPDLVRRANEAGLKVTLTNDLPQSPQPAPPVSRAAYRIIQESLTNAAKHAPGAPVRVAIEGEGADLAIVITSGPPMVPVQPAGQVDSGGLGLAGMAERAATAGGRLDVEHAPNGQFTVRARLPLQGYEPPKVGAGKPTIDGSQTAVEVR